MKYFTNKSQLARMDFHTKLIMTYFLIFILLAIGFSIYMSSQRTNLSAQGAADYYRGNDERMVFGKELTELTETTHFHAFIMPIIFLTTGHLFLLSAWSSRWKTVVITGGFCYVLLDLAKPWLIRYAAPGFGLLAPINSMLLGVTFLIFIFVPLYEMWVLNPSPAGRREPNLED
jgi:hypothetical protein